MPLRQPLRLASAAALLAALLGVAWPSHAQPAASAPPAAADASEGRRAIILRTVIEDRGQRRLPSAEEPELQAMALMLDGLLGDTAQDLGLSVDLTERSVPDPADWRRATCPTRPGSSTACWWRRCWRPRGAG